MAEMLAADLAALSPVWIRTSEKSDSSRASMSARTFWSRGRPPPLPTTSRTGEVYRAPPVPSFPALATGLWEGRASGLRQTRAVPGKEVPAGTRDGARPGAASPGVTGARRDTVGAGVASVSDASRELRVAA